MTDTHSTAKPVRSKPSKPYRGFPPVNHRPYRNSAFRDRVLA
jgi:hypothetical protein